MVKEMSHEEYLEYMLDIKDREIAELKLELESHNKWFIIAGFPFFLGLGMIALKFEEDPMNIIGPIIILALFGLILYIIGITATYIQRKYDEWKH